MSSAPIEIDWYLKPNHHHLTNEDVCYYFMEYTVGGRYDASAANQLILNFKKDLTYKGTQAWKYKQIAINDISAIYIAELDKIIDFKRSTLVPVPPSKCKSNKLYDDRMSKLLNSLSFKKGADVRELLNVERDMPPSHATNNRDINDIMSYLKPDIGLFNNVKERIYLFDDVLVTGAHFAACKNIIHDLLPDNRIFGVFIARSIHQHSNDFDAIDDFDFDCY